jgi:hypothetical protein
MVQACGHENGASVSTKRPGKNKAQTEVVLVGTFHSLIYESSVYHPDTLRYLLKRIDPQAVFAEIRPKDIKKDGLGRAPADIKHVVVPWARKRGLPIVAIDWWKEGSRQMHAKFMAELRKTERGRKKLAQRLDEIAVHRDRFDLATEMTVAYIHSQEFSRKDQRVRIRATQVLGEGPGNLFWGERTRHMTERVLRRLEHHRGKRIVIVTGAAHRGDIERKLRKEPGVRVVELAKVAPLDNLPSYSGAAGGVEEMERVLVARCFGRTANSHPSRVDTTALARVLTRYQKACSEQNKHREPLLRLVRAQISFFEGDYPRAYKQFSEAAGTGSSYKLMGKAPLSTFATIRAANMLDLLKKRNQALELYNSVEQPPMMAHFAARYIREPYSLPNKKK